MERYLGRTAHIPGGVERHHTMLGGVVTADAHCVLKDGCTGHTQGGIQELEGLVMASRSYRNGEESGVFAEMAVPGSRLSGIEF